MALFVCFSVVESVLAYFWFLPERLYDGGATFDPPFWDKDCYCKLAFVLFFEVFGLKETGEPSWF